jgi:parallel beta-helix repeat protein
VKRLVSTIALILLLASVLTSAFNIRSVESEPETWITEDGSPPSFTMSISNQNWRDYDMLVESAEAFLAFQVFDEGDFDRLSEWSDFVCADEDSVEFVVGISDEQGCGELVDFAEVRGCHLIDKVLIKDEVVAIVVDVPLMVVSSFVTDVMGTGASRYVEPNVVFNASIVPNDHSWKRQWAPVRIEADYAWNHELGAASVVVAVVDTGVDWDHPDLRANCIPLGYDWVNNDSDAMDDMGHGTHCAGIIAATQGNSIGIAGLAQVSIIAEKGLNERGSGRADWLAKAIIHAVDQSAKIVSMSWGAFARSELVYDAVKYAYDNGVLLVGSAGNDATDRISYPAAFEEVIAVCFTNFGDWIELAAPGVDIYSALWDDSYGYMSGTSMACPHVAGVAALVWSQFPYLSRDEVRLRLRQAAEDLGDPGFDQYYGHGRINIERAVEKDLPEHDLLVECWEAPRVEELGRRVKANGTVLNFGKSCETEVTIQLLANDSVVDTASILSLDANLSEEVSLSWSPTVEGTYNITFCILPVLSEDVVRNNFFSAYVSVRTPQVILVPTDYETIGSAVNAAYPGDTVSVGSGIYYEHVLVSKSLKLLGESPDTTVIDGNGSGTALHVETTDNVFLSGFSIENASIGILLCNSDNVMLRDNDLVGNNYSLRISGSSLSDFIQDIDASNKVNGRPVCYFVNQNDREVLADAGYVGLVNSTSIDVKDLSLNEDVLLAYTTDSCVENITVSNAFYGVKLYWSSNNTVSGNALLDNTYGMELRYSWNNRIANNNVASNLLAGVRLLLSSTANRVDSNTISENFRGIYLSYCANNVLMNNIMANNHYNFGVHGSLLSHFVQDIEISNTVNGRPVYYLVNHKKPVVMDPSGFPDAGYLGVVNSTNLEMQDLDLVDNVQGILLAYTDNSTIKNMSVSRNDVGILLYECNNNKIESNVASWNLFGIDLKSSNDNEVSSNAVESNEAGGIHLYMSNNNTIAENVLSNITLLAFAIELSFENIILKNEMSNSQFAMALTFSSFNSIYANNLTNSAWGILLLPASDDNVIYHNSFINNSVEHVWNLVGARNIWDDGYPSGGNYWSDYTGVDLKWGVDQDKLGSDAIGDAAYIIDVDNRDRYPLMKPWNPSLPKGPGDVNGDGQVDIYDVVLASTAYGSEQGESNWNPYADLAPLYGVIDIYDVVTIVSNYGKTYS